MVVNTCGFLATACEEAIDHILELAALKQGGRLKKILVTGCMAQRYKEEILKEMPEVDGILGTGSYTDIVEAAQAVLEEGATPCLFGNIHTAAQGGPRILSTPPWYAYLRIAVTTIAPTASSPPCGASTAAALWRSCWTKRRS